jgi:hypothetical protein
MRRKSQTNEKLENTRVYIPFAQDEVEGIDSWGFAKHIRARAQAVRQLVFKALASEQRADARR